MDEVYRIYFISEPMYQGVYEGVVWWYLRFLRWMKMNTLKDFLMRWFYEPTPPADYIYRRNPFPQVNPEERFRQQWNNEEDYRVGNSFSQVNPEERFRRQWNNEEAYRVVN